MLSEAVKDFMYESIAGDCHNSIVVCREILCDVMCMSVVSCLYKGAQAEIGKKCRHVRVTLSWHPAARNIGSTILENMRDPFL